MFFGEFEHAVDDKGRMTIPAKFREYLDGGLVVTKGIDPCLWLYPLDAWLMLSGKVSRLSLTQPSAREFRRQVFGGAANSVPDRQGRVNLPAYLREYANLDNQAVIVGLYDHCEIWNAERWKERSERSHNDPDGRASMFANLDV